MGTAPIVVIGQAIGVPVLDRLGVIALTLLLALGVLVRRVT